MTRPTITLSGETLDRTRLEALLAQDALLVFEECDFQQVDLSRMNLQDSSSATAPWPRRRFTRPIWRARAGSAAAAVTPINNF